MWEWSSRVTIGCVWVENILYWFLRALERVAKKKKVQRGR